MKFLEEFLSIFFDKNEQKNFKYSWLISKKEHYQKELEKIYFDDIFVAAEYEILRPKIESYKYRSEVRHVKDFASIFDLMIDDFIVKNPQENIRLTPIPMHWSRYLTRWFDHMSKIVKVLSKRSWIPCFQPFWVSFSRKQSRLSIEKRRKNRKNVYRLKKWKKLPETVFLFDDIVSTGTTVNHYAQLLKNNWTKKVYVFILASNQDLKN